MHWQQGGEIVVEKSCIASLEPIPTIKGELVHFFCIFRFWGWASTEFNQSDRFENRPDRFGGSSLTGLENQPNWFVPSAGTCSRGVCICPGWALVCFEFCFGGLCSFVVSVFCLGCVEPLPLPKGTETFLFQVILLFAFVWLSIACSSFFVRFFSFTFSLWLSNVCCQCTHQGGDWGPMWFEERWMVPSWCDEWLTTLCGLTLG
jgi:hypothetical protein